MRQVEGPDRFLQAHVVKIHRPSARIYEVGVGQQLRENIRALQVNASADAALHLQDCGVVSRMTAAVPVAAPGVDVGVLRERAQGAFQSQTVRKRGIRLTESGSLQRRTCRVKAYVPQRIDTRI